MYLCKIHLQLFKYFWYCLPTVCHQVCKLCRTTSGYCQPLHIHMIPHRFISYTTVCVNDLLTSSLATTNHATCNPSNPLNGTSLVNISHSTTPYEKISHDADTGICWITWCKNKVKIRIIFNCTNLWSHPRKCPHKWHVCCVVVKFWRAKITNLIIHKLHIHHNIDATHIQKMY